jgi:hypothetical protein
MSQTVEILVHSLLMIGAITVGLVWYALALARRESREARHTARQTSEAPFASPLDPDSHLGRVGSE